jgi:hypothetical protein
MRLFIFIKEGDKSAFDGFELIEDVKHRCIIDSLDDGIQDASFFVWFRWIEVRAALFTALLARRSLGTRAFRIESMATTS